MKRVLRPAALLVGVALFSLRGAVAHADNLVPDGSFDSGVSAWTASGTVLTLEHEDGFGSTLVGGSGPGSMKLTHAYWGSGTYGAYIDIQVTPGTIYRIGASYYVPSSHNPADKTLVQVYWYDDAGKSRDNVYLSGRFVADQWMRREENLAAPAYAVTARFYLRVGNPEDETETQPAIGYFDDALFEPVTTADAFQALFVPATAAKHGQSGTYWSTNFWLANATGTTVWVDGAFLQQGQDNSAAVASPIRVGTIPPGGFTKLDDLVTTLGALESTGGIYLRASAAGTDLPSELVKVTTHTFTPNPYGDGVYGQGIPAVPAGTMATATVPGVFQGSDLRTNLGALNTSAVTIALKVTVLNAAGNEEVSTTWTLYPYEQRQVGLPSLGLSSLDGGTVIFELQGSGSFRGYTSTVDQSSGDAVYNEAR